MSFTQINFLETFLLGIPVLFDFATRISRSFGGMVFISEIEQFKGFFGNFPKKCSYHLVPFQNWSEIKASTRSVKKKHEKEKETLMELTLELRKAAW